MPIEISPPGILFTPRGMYFAIYGAAQGENMAISWQDSIKQKVTISP